MTVRSSAAMIPRPMATTAARLRSGLYAGRSPQEGLKSLRKYLARVKVDELHTVRQARAADLTWREIGELLGMSEAGVRKRYQGQGIT